MAAPDGDVWPWRLVLLLLLRVSATSVANLI
jgi:hypothetical protein